MTTAPVLLASVPTTLWIGNKQVPGSTGATFDVIDPATENVLATVADATALDGATALDTAASAQPEWAATPSRTRSEILRRAWELVIERRDEFALLMTLEMGNPLAESRS